MTPLAFSDADRAMRGALTALVQHQLQTESQALPQRDEAAELQTFVDWCVRAEHGIEWDAKQRGWWAHVCEQIARSSAAQPQVAVQGGFLGPITYDLAALLRAPAHAWEEEQELDWAIRYWEQARKAGLLKGSLLAEDFGEFWRRLEWTGLQRHLMLLGEACRLKQTAGDNTEFSRLFAYCIKVSTRYIEFSPLTRLLEDLRGGLTATGFNLR